MSVGSKSQGYTIMEVMIFLAVSGFMFVIAATFISGKQAKAEFRQGMTSANNAIQNVINNVNDGFYPSGANFKCTSDDTGGRPQLAPPNVGATTSTQGTKKGCVFMGKVVMFGGVTDPGRGYSILTMAGRQYKGSANAATVPGSFDEAKPVAVTGNPTYELTEKANFEGGMTMTRAFLADSPGKKLDGIGFYSSFGAYDSGGALESGAQNVVVVAIPGPGNFNPALSQMATEAEGSSTDANVQANPDITLCFDSGSGQYGTIVLGGPGGQRLATKMQIYSSKPDHC
jgi:type II secretory pathway pseudopilin PulG